MVESRLPQIVEDLFQLVAKKEEFGKAILRATPDASAIADFTITGVLSDIANVSDAIFFFDLQSLPDSTRSDVRSELISTDLSYLTQVLRHKNSYCIVCARTSPTGPGSWKNGISFSYQEEEALIINRAAFLEGKIQGPIAANIREQMKRFMWGNEQMVQLWAIDDAIRSGTINERANNFAKGLVEFDLDVNEYAARLKYLMQDEGRGEAEKEKLPILPWSEAVTAALIERALFILTTFDDLTPGDFDLIMRMLLCGESVASEMAPTRLASNETAYKPHFDRLRNETLSENEGEWLESLTLAYRRVPDRVLQLIDVRQRDGRLEFFPDHKKQMARELLRANRPLLMEKLLVEETVEKSMLFKIPDRIAEQLAKRYAEHTIALPAVSRSDFVFRWTQAHAQRFIRKWPQLANYNANAEVDPLKSLLTILADERIPEGTVNLAKEFSEYVSLFLLHLLANDDTAPQVDELLERLMDVPGMHTRHYLVFMFVRILRRNANFRSLFWLKRLLAEGDVEAKESALAFLARGIELGRREGDKGSDTTLLQTLKSWIPTGTKHASGQNSHTAALLAPRLALHRALARIKDNEHGAVVQLSPLFDLNLDDGLALDSASAIELLTAPINGSWIGDDLKLMSQLADARWQLGSVDSSNRESTFRTLSRFDSTLSEDSWNQDARQLTLIALLVEAFAALTGHPDSADQRRLEIGRSIIGRIAEQFEKDQRRSLARRGYGLAAALGASRSAAAQRRGACARWIGDTFYELYN